MAYGYVGNTTVNTVKYITIASTGNATDFGDLLTTNVYLSGAFQDHGGIAA